MEKKLVIIAVTVHNTVVRNCIVMGDDENAVIAKTKEKFIEIIQEVHNRYEFLTPYKAADVRDAFDAGIVGFDFPIEGTTVHIECYHYNEVAEV